MMDNAHKARLLLLAPTWLPWIRQSVSDLKLNSKSTAVKTYLNCTVCNEAASHLLDVTDLDN